jgi:hypothetical protein
MEQLTMYRIDCTPKGATHDRVAYFDTLSSAAASAERWRMDYGRPVYIERVDALRRVTGFVDVIR